MKKLLNNDTNIVGETMLKLEWDILLGNIQLIYINKMIPNKKSVIDHILPITIYFFYKYKN